METIRGFILDVDGTLLDSNDAHAEAYMRALHEHGFEVESGQVRRLIGMGSDKLLPAAVGVQAEAEIGQRITERKREIFLSELLPRLRPMPGARELLEHLRAAEIVRVVATSAGADEVRQLLQAARVADLVDDLTTADDVDESKPDPGLVRAALRKCGLPPRLVTMLGDTPYDLEAAHGAGVRFIGLRCGGWSDRELTGATGIYNDPADLLRHLQTALQGAGAA
ncbi:MAG: HAD family hydrolase [Planctomycetota bacterium]